MIERESIEYEKLILTTEMRDKYNEFTELYKEFIVYRDEIIMLKLRAKRC